MVLSLDKEVGIELEPHVRKSLEQLKHLDRIVQISFSGGKDSTALLGLFLLAKKLGVVKTFEVVHSNTLMEMPFLDAHVNRVKSFCESQYITFHFLTAPMKDRFMYNVFGRGLAIPNRNFRWCTDRLKLKPIKANLNPNLLMATGERLGESHKRDAKLNSLGCGKSDDCGLEEQSKIVENTTRPLINWSACQVWDFIALMDIQNILPNVFSELSEIYSINETSDGSMRTGCIGCPLVNQDKSLQSFVSRNNGYSPLLKVEHIYKRLINADERLIRFNKTKFTKDLTGEQKGCIKLSSRLLAYSELLEIENEVQKYDPGFLLIQPDEKQEIEKLLDAHTYPRGYDLVQQQVIEDIENYEKLKQEFKSMTKTKTITTAKTARPFIKWAGGKNQLLTKFTENLPKHFTKYCEPFIGGGALMFHLLNTQEHIEEVLINDSNPDLMLTYRVIQQYVTKLINVLDKVQTEYYGKSEDDRRKYFEAVRKKFNTDAETFDYSGYSTQHITRAAIVIFLNKTCFNGLWRVRKSDGGFNTSFGKYDSPLICDKHNLELVSEKLQKVFIKSGDYRECSSFIDSNTLVYLDPPYIPASETANFVGYSKDSWGLFDNLKLSEFIRSQHAKQAKILLSSSNTVFWDDLDFMNKIEVSAKRNVSCKVESREGVKELILRNY